MVGIADLLVWGIYSGRFSRDMKFAEYLFNVQET